MSVSVRDSFVARFGEQQADAIVAAAEAHENGVHDSRGSDPFKWAVAICIGYECFIVEQYRKHHGITAPVDDIKTWIKAEADLGSHDGDVDYITAFTGGYAEYLADEVTS